MNCFAILTLVCTTAIFDYQMQQFLLIDTQLVKFTIQYKAAFTTALQHVWQFLLILALTLWLLAYMVMKRLFFPAA